MNRAERNAVVRVLRAAIDGTAGEIRPDELAPLHLAPRTGIVGQAGPVRASRGLSRPVAALSAAAALIAIAAASVGAASELRADRAEMTGSAPAIGALRLIPRYSVAAGIVPGRIQAAEVIDSATGKVVAIIREPRPYNIFTAVAADTAGRTFVLYAQRRRFTGKHHTPVYGRSQLFSGTLPRQPGSRPITLTPLRLPSRPGNWSLMALALSPDGTRLAAVYVVDTGGNDRAADVRLLIYSMTSRAAHVFHGNWQIGMGGLLDPGSVSWAADDRTLALDAYASGRHPGAVELFSADATGGTIASNSRPLIKVKAYTYPTTVDVRILPDGARVVLGMRTHSPAQELGEVSTATGRVVRTITLNPPPVNGVVPALANVVWTNDSGSVMLLQFNDRSPGGLGQRVYMVLHNGKFTRLPGHLVTLQRAW